MVHLRLGTRKLPRAPQPRGRAQAWNSLGPPNDFCSPYAKHLGLNIQKVSPVSPGWGQQDHGHFAQKPMVTSSDQEESKKNGPLSLAGRGLVWLRKAAKGPRGDNQQVPRAGWARRKQDVRFPAISLSCPRAAISQASFTISSHLNCSFLEDAFQRASLFLSHWPGPGIALCSMFHPFYPGLVHGQPKILQLTPPC